LGRVPPAAAAALGVAVGVGALVATALARRPGDEQLGSEDAAVERLVALEIERSESRLSEAEYQRAREAVIRQVQQP
jgi:hypothetical protein